MPFLIKDPPFTYRVNSNGTDMTSMINLFLSQGVRLQRIQTLDGYIIPLSIQDGLTRLKIRPYTDQEFDTLPHVTMTSEFEWDPSVLEHKFKEDEQ
jgi:hypothetical protein